MTRLLRLPPARFRTSLALGAAAHAVAADCPTRPLRFILPFGAGGGNATVHVSSKGLSPALANLVLPRRGSGLE